MQPSIQDVQKPFDPTSYVTITGAALGQLADGIVPYTDKGLVIVTTDVAGVAQVPDAATTTKWQTYLWVRRQATSVVAYVWNPTVASDIDLLQWTSVSVAALADGSVTNGKLGAGAVTNDKVFSIDWSKLTGIPATILMQGDDAGGDLTGTYPNPTIAANAVDNAKLKSDAVTDANRAVTTNHIRDAAVTSAKLAADVLASTSPAGAVMLYGGSAAPTGWFECDGTAVSRGTYASLFAALGTAYGAGDGVATFNLPDMRGYFARGWDHGAGVDTARALGSTQQDAFKDHTHGPNNQIWSEPGSGGTTNLSSTAGASSKLIATSTAQAPNNGGTETRPKNVSFMYIIKH